MNFEKEIVSVVQQHGYMVFYNFKGEELLRVKEDFYPWLQDYFTGHLVGCLELAKENMENMSKVIENQVKVYKD